MAAFGGLPVGLLLAEAVWKRGSGRRRWRERRFPFDDRATWPWAASS